MNAGQPKASLDRRTLAPILKQLGRVNQVLARAYPGESEERQPVHTVYGGAQLFKAADSGFSMNALSGMLFVLFLRREVVGHYCRQTVRSP